MQHLSISRSRSRRRKKTCPPLSRSEELLAINKFIASHGATRAPIHPEYDYIDFEDPRTICVVRIGKTRKGRSGMGLVG